MKSSDFAGGGPRTELIVGSQSGHPNPPNPARVFCLEPADGKPKQQDDTLVEFWHLIRFRKATIFTIALVGATVAALYTLREAPAYQALTTIELESGDQNPFSRIGDVDVSGPLSGADFIQTQIKILQSRTLLQRTRAKVQATHRKPFEQPDQIAAWCQALQFKWCSTPRHKIIAAAPVQVTAKSSETSRIVEIRVDSTDPSLAADFANALASEYIEQNMESRWNAAQGASGYLTRQLEELRAKLQESERALQSYGQTNGLLYMEDKSSIQDEKLKQLQTELSSAQADRVAKQAIYAVATSSPVEALPQIIDNVRLGQEQAMLADLKRQLAELSAALTPEHYKVIRVQAQIKELEASLKKQRNDILTRIKIDYDSAALREKLVEGRYTSQTALVSELGKKVIYYNVLKQEVETIRHIYDALLQKVKEFSVASALRASNVRVVDAALVPPQPYKPDLTRNIAMGLVSGIMLGIGFVLTRNRVDRSIKAPGEAHFHLKLPELGVIPSSVMPMNSLTASMSSKDEKANGNWALLSLGSPKSNGRERIELVTWQDKASPVAESFRNALASILFAQQYVARPRVILITSPGRAEGKSTSATNLAIALSEINQKVLLIDGDTRRSGLHKLFEVSNTWGLSDLLRERTPLQDCPLEALARKTNIDGLYLLPSGPGTLSVSNLLYSGRMSELLERARSLFDTIVIDTPPILYVSDARVLARLADAAVLVIRAGVTTRDAALAAKDRFDHDGIPVLGIILNDWDLKSKSPYGYAYAYRYDENGNGNGNGNRYSPSVPDKVKAWWN